MKEFILPRTVKFLKLTLAVVHRSIAIDLMWDHYPGWQHKYLLLWTPVQVLCRSYAEPLFYRYWGNDTLAPLTNSLCFCITDFEPQIIIVILFSSGVNSMPQLNFIPQEFFVFYLFAACFYKMVTYQLSFLFQIKRVSILEHYPRSHHRISPMRALLLPAMSINSRV